MVCFLRYADHIVYVNLPDATLDSSINQPDAVATVFKVQHQYVAVYGVRYTINDH